MDPVLAVITVGALLSAVLLVVLIEAWTGPKQLSGPGGSEATSAQVQAEDVEPPTDEAPAPPPKAEAPSAASRFRDALARTRESLRGGLSGLFGAKIDDELLDDLEMALLSADVGMPTTQRLLEPIRDRMKAGETDGEKLRLELKRGLGEVLRQVDAPFAESPAEGPLVVLVVGVNGSGKTTTIGKLASRYRTLGKKVVLGAGDTYRAAAAEQLKVWAERAEVDIVAHQEGADPGAVVFDTLSHALAKGHDVVILDTAGRLQTKKPLMEQLSKVRRVIDKKVPGAPHETLLVVDGTIGQNALSQGQLFHDATPLTGVVITKLDGTAKGGMVFAVASELQLPVKLVGVGEGIGDLRNFEIDAFVDALL